MGLEIIGSKVIDLKTLMSAKIQELNIYKEEIVVKKRGKLIFTEYGIKRVGAVRMPNKQV